MTMLRKSKAFTKALPFVAIGALSLIVGGNLWREQTHAGQTAPNSATSFECVVDAGIQRGSTFRFGVHDLVLRSDSYQPVQSTRMTRTEQPFELHAATRIDEMPNIGIRIAAEGDRIVFFMLAGDMPLAGRCKAFQ